MTIVKIKRGDEIVGEELTESRNLIVRFVIVGYKQTTAVVGSFKEAADLFRKAIDDACVGASKVSYCTISEGNQVTACVSYNGRVWSVLVRAGLFNVTFFNVLANRRGMLIDNVSEVEADAVISRTSDKKSPQFYLQDVRKESVTAQAAA